MSDKINKEIYTKLANRIYDLDGEVYRAGRFGVSRQVIVQDLANWI